MSSGFIVRTRGTSLETAACSLKSWFRPPIDRYIIPVVAYDRLAESIRLINGGPVVGAEKLTRRRRFLPVAVDVDGDIAVTVFLRRTHGGAEWEEHVLAATGSRWSVLGGGGSGLEELDVLTHPAPVGAGHFLQEDGSGGVAADSGWIQYARLCSDPRVSLVLVDRRREIRPPQHGRMVIVWRGHQRVSATAVDRGGQGLETLRLGR